MPRTPEDSHYIIARAFKEIKIIVTKGHAEAVREKIAARTAPDLTDATTNAGCIVKIVEARPAAEDAAKPVIRAVRAKMQGGMIDRATEAAAELSAITQARVFFRFNGTAVPVDAAQIASHEDKKRIVDATMARAQDKGRSIRVAATPAASIQQSLSQALPG